ncbi:MAG: hypothetical protein NTY15_13230 [Planctomycetota bacterium]|nr:hypothetical protein [Planctomycetota bacterium]
MAIRIPVVISQHERRAGSIADYEEQLITRIVMESGLDATLIADLKAIEHDTTDHLCIEGLKGDFALATWESTQYVCEHLHRLGVPSLEILPVDGSPKSHSGVESVPAKKIFLISLATNVSIDTTIKTLKDLLQSRSTPVFSIGALIHRARTETAKSPSEARPFAHSISQPIERAKPEIAKPEIAKRVDQPASVTSAETDDFPNLDLLMDELDQFNL